MSNGAVAQTGRKIGKIVSQVVQGIFVVMLLIFALKGCVVTIWNPPSNPTTYAVHGADGRSLSMIFLDNRNTYIVYTDEKMSYAETVLCTMKGTYGTNYLWRFWKIEGPGIGPGPFGWRIYPDGAEPVVMETTVLNKFTHGTGNPVFREKGAQTHPVILFANNKVRYEGMWLKKERTNPADLKILKQVLLSGVR